MAAEITRHDGNRQHPLGAWDVAARRSPVRHLLQQGSLAAYAIDNKGGLKKEAAVKIGQRFWDILVLGDTSE
jgi:hypothetical protein